MKRKIIRQGHNTLTITLPAKWVKRFNLKSGEEIDLSEKDNGLYIAVEKRDDVRRVEFDINGFDIPTIWKYFMAVYREGYDEVMVKFEPNLNVESPYKFFSQHKLDLKYKKESEKKPIVEVLQLFVNRFIGFEIVEHGKDYVLIKEMGNITSKEFDNSLRRVFFIIQQMAEETIEAIEKNSPKLLNHMHDVDINLDKFHDYCIRVLNKMGNKEPRKTSVLFSMLILLELVGDEFKAISHHLLQDFPNAKFNKKLNIIPKTVKEQLDSFYTLFYNFDAEKVKKLSDFDKERYFNFSKFYKEATEDEKEIFHHLRIINRYINTLLELRIEMEF